MFLLSLYILVVPTVQSVARMTMVECTRHHNVMELRRTRMTKEDDLNSNHGLSTLDVPSLVD